MSEPIEIHDVVKERYGAIANGTSASCCGGGDDGCGCNTQLYDNSLLVGLPADVTNISVGCGDPVTIAGLHAGETVLDLGSGGGIDCFLAARQVGENGYVIGVDMTPAMLERPIPISSRWVCITLNSGADKSRRCQYKTMRLMW